MERFATSGLRDLRSTLSRLLAGLRADDRGATIVEAAFVLPIIVALLMGAVSYGGWFMAAHSLQQAANEGARAAIAGLDEADRAAIVEAAVRDGVLSAGTVDADRVDLTTSMEGNLYTVRVAYVVDESIMMGASFVPMPSSTIVRQATVRLTSF